MKKIAGFRSLIISNFICP